MKHHPLAKRKVHLKPARSTPNLTTESIFEIEDYWKNVSGTSWMKSGGNTACMKYAYRAGQGGLPLDDEVLYGKVGGFGYLVHVSELDGVVGDEHPED